MVRSIKASEFRAKCFALLEEVERTGNRLIITKNGRPIADVVPHEPPNRNLIGVLEGRGEILGDIISPLDVEWESMK